MPTPNLALPFIAQGQAQKEVTHNEALLRLDALVQIAVRSRSLAAPPGSPADGERWSVAAGATGAAAPSTSSAAPECPPLPRLRWAQQFEALRDASDTYLAATGARPKVFLVNLGPVAVHTARATFAKNFFEAGGIQATTSERGATTGFAEAGDAVADALASGAHLVWICSSDAVYAEGAVEVASALRDAGLSPVYLAGNPGDRRAAETEAGVSEFVHVGVDVLDVLRRAHESIGTPTGAVTSRNREER